MASIKISNLLAIPTKVKQAALSGTPEVITTWVGSGNDVNTVGVGDCTILHWAARAGHSNVIKTILDLGGDKNIRNAYNLTPEEYASNEGKAKAAWLIKTYQPKAELLCR